MEERDEFSYRNQLWQALLPALSKLSPAQLTWRIDENSRGIGGLIDRIASIEDHWLNDVAFRDRRVAPEAAPENDLSALLEKYRRVREKTEYWLAWTPEREMRALLIEVPNLPEGWKPPMLEPDVRWTFQFVFRHEAYHLGQIVTLMRLQGIETPV